jgi:hypothetical protein
MTTTERFAKIIDFITELQAADIDAKESDPQDLYNVCIDELQKIRRDFRNMQMEVQGMDQLRSWNERLRSDRDRARKLFCEAMMRHEGRRAEDIAKSNLWDCYEAQQ